MLALCGVSAAVMKPTALTLNVLVAAIATARYARAGWFSWSLFWPFAVASIPMSYVGGLIELPGHVYKPVVGTILLLAAYPLLRKPPPGDGTDAPPRPVSTIPALACGGGIGLLSGLTGTGGGIFLTPVLLLSNWAAVRQTGGVSAAFVFVNSLAGLAGNLSSLRAMPTAIVYWGPAAALGGLIGSELGSRHLGSLALRRILAVVLVIAG